MADVQSLGTIAYGKYMIRFEAQVTANSVVIRWSEIREIFPLQITLLLHFRNMAYDLGEPKSSSSVHDGWYFLPAQSRLLVKIVVGEEDLNAIINLPSKFEGLEIPPMELYLGPEHDLGPWIAFAPTDKYNWTKDMTQPFVNNILLNALFFLPSGPNFAILPNPKDRYLLDLIVPRNWKKNKKLKKYAKTLRLSVNRSLRDSLVAAKNYHQEFHESTWITDECIDYLCNVDCDGVDMYSFELWDDLGDNNFRLAACCLSYSVGNHMNDYTMCTPIRDKRSLGSIICRVLGDLLTKAGFQTWYWGMKVDYMAEYDQYGGQFRERVEFFEKWEEGRRFQPESPLHEMIENGEALIQPLPEDANLNFG